MTTDAQAFAALQKLTPADAVAYLQARQEVVETYGWQDLWQEEHARQFTISRLTSADLLAALQEKITKSVSGDLTRKDFARDARQLLQEAGWWGTKEVVEPGTGEILKTRFDVNRLKTIFDTNTRQAYAAGQWESFERSAQSHPYLRYVTKGDGKVRPAHAAWNGVTLPVGDDFWLTHSPMNDYGCRCRLVAVSRRAYALGKTPTGADMKKAAPTVVMRDWLNRRTGEIERVPAGIGPGFGYNPGKARDRATQRVVQEKLVALDAPLGAALWQTVKVSAAAGVLQSWQRMLKAVGTSKRAGGAAALVHTVDAQTLRALAEQDVKLASAAVLMRDSELLHALRDTKAARGATLPPEVWEQLPTLLETATPYLDTEDTALVYAIPLQGKAGKVIVRVNYTEKTRLGGERARLTANFIQTGGVVNETDLPANRYKRLKE